MQVLIFALIARTQPLEIVGIYAVVNALWLLWRALGPLAFDQAAYRFIPTYISNKEPGKIYGFFLHSVSAAFKSGVFGTAVCCVLAALSHLLGAPFRPDIAVLLIIFGLALPAYALIGLYVGILRSTGSLAAAQLPESVVLQAAFGIFVLFLWVSNETTLVMLAAAQMVAAISVALLYAIVWRRYARILPQTMLSNQERSDITGMRKSVLATLAVTEISVRSPVAIVSLVLGPAAAALLEAAQRFGTLGSLTTWAVGTVVSPLLAQTYSKGDLNQVQNLYSLASILQTGCSLGLLIALFWWGEWVLTTILGVDFGAASIPTVLLAIATLVNASGGVASIYLTMTGREMTVFQFSISRLIAILAFVPFLGWTLGVSGVAGALILGSILRDIGLTAYVAGRTSLRPGIWSTHELLRLARLALSKTPRKDT